MERARICGAAKDGGGVSFDNLKLVSRITLCSNECRRRHPHPCLLAIAIAIVSWQLQRDLAPLNVAAQSRLQQSAVQCGGEQTARSQIAAVMHCGGHVAYE